MKKLFVFMAAALMSVSMYSITVADAIAEGKKLADDGKTPSASEYTIEGYVVKWYNNYYNGTQSFYLHDEKGFDGYCEFEVFKGGVSGNVFIGAKVSVTGKLYNYKGTVEVKEVPVTILEDAVPVEMSYDDVIAALSSIKDPAEKKTNYGINYVKFVGYATSKGELKEGQVSVFVAGDKDADKGGLQAFKLAATENVAKGAKIEVIGMTAKYLPEGATEATLEIVYGSVKVLEQPTAIENTSVSVKAQKVMENGQLYIIRNGVKYNAAGAVVE